MNSTAFCILGLVGVSLGLCESTAAMLEPQDDAGSVQQPQNPEGAVAPSDAQELRSHIRTSGLEFNFMPGAWMPRVSGNSTFGSSSIATELDNRNDLNLDDSNAAFTADLSVRKDEDWQIKAGGFAYSIDSRGRFEGADAMEGELVLETGDAFSASFDMTSFNFEAAYWFTAVEGPGQTQLMFAPAAGFRYVDVDITVDIDGEGEVDGGGEWACPYLGGELELRWDSAGILPLIQQVQIAGGVGAGPALGGDGGWMAHLHADLTVRFTQNFGVFFGYKLVDLAAEDDDYELSGGLEGLYFGGVVRF